MNWAAFGSSNDATESWDNRTENFDKMFGKRLTNLSFVLCIVMLSNFFWNTNVWRHFQSSVVEWIYSLLWHCFIFCETHEPFRACLFSCTRIVHNIQVLLCFLGSWFHTKIVSKPKQKYFWQKNCDKLKTPKNKIPRRKILRPKVPKVPKYPRWK